MTKTIKSEPLKRSMILEREQVNEENRTVEVAFSSEINVERWFGIEILDHNPESIRLGLLNNGGAVLVDHTRRDHVGVVEVARVDSDRKGRATLRFGKGERADEVFQDVVDGIRKHISVGYKIHKFERTKGENGSPDTIRVTDWEPYEISIVSVPADASVGVGRNADEPINQGAEMLDPINTPAEESRSANNPAAPQAPAIHIDESAIRQQERTRVAEITRAATDAPWDLTALRDQAINDGMNISEFRAAAFEVASSQPKPAIVRSSEDMFQRENQEYSLVRALSAQMSGDWSQAGFEREMSQELSRGGSIIGGGLMVPMSVFTASRAADTGNNAGLIGTNHMSSQFIDVLRASTLLGRLGARFLPGLNGNVAIPKKTASASFGWLAEAEDASASSVNTGNVTLSGKHVGGVVPMTFELMRQSAPAIEQIVREDMLAGLSLSIDQAGFSGTGADNQPTGILNTTGIQTLTLADTTGKIPTWEEIVQMEGKLDDANALMGSLAYAFRPTVHSALKTARKDGGSGRFVIEGGDCNGYKPYSSTQLPDKTSLFGNFSDVLIGTWGMVELIPKRNEKTGGLDIGCHQMADVAVRNAQSFVKSV
ncbi:phage major capsid protein [Vibrio vulnificus]|uniref:phage major capsid protein n=1 Tax=Vibrio vulnificus TaxID=672 RepID=UPI001F4E509F|nr:phage major capsid protein [Vibrio vulnificus]